MAASIYKYFSSEIMPLVFQRNGFCGIKCSFPKEYNDPYELFLGVDLTVSPQLLATYRDIVQELPQDPTTCFSKSPTVAPMWAHYANNHSGFVLQFDIEELARCFKDLVIEEVTYRDTPDESIKSFLQRAAGTKKPRHAYALQQAVSYTAYFSKHTAWSYEQEVRLVAGVQDCEDVGASKILFVPSTCLSAIIVGQNATSDMSDLSIVLATQNNLSWYRSVIGKSKAEPSFKDRSDLVAVFDGERISLSKRICKSCSEPVEGERALCPWCSITEVHEMEAARGNPLRVLDRFGLLEQYYENADKIGRKE